MPARLTLRPGERFGRLTLLQEAPTIREVRRWLCRCDCGIEVTVFQHSLRSGRTKSCGCLRREVNSALGKSSATHGHAGAMDSAEYRSWHSMKTRCLNQKHDSYVFYGGRGITICDRWLNSFPNFLADMGPRPAGTSLDRYPDQNGNYEKSNCRWADAIAQARNQRNNRFIEYGKERLVLAEWAARVGISRVAISYRIDKLGWSIERALTEKQKPASRFLEYDGQRLNIVDWARRVGLPSAAIRARIDRFGWSVERALTEPLRITSQTRLERGGATAA